MAFADEPWADRVALFVSSSEAADLGLLLTQILTGREPLVSRELSYHGGAGLSREVSTHPRWGAHLASLNIGITPRPFPLTVTRCLPVPKCGVGAVDADHVCATECLHEATSILAGAPIEEHRSPSLPSPRFKQFSSVTISFHKPPRWA